LAIKDLSNKTGKYDVNIDFYQTKTWKLMQRFYKKLPSTGATMTNK